MGNKEGNTKPRGLKRLGRKGDKKKASANGRELLRTQVVGASTVGQNKGRESRRRGNFWKARKT